MNKKILSPVFYVISERNINFIDRQLRKLFKEGYYPVGTAGRMGNDWIQVIIKEGCTCPKKDDLITEYLHDCPAHGHSEYEIPLWVRKDFHETDKKGPAPTTHDKGQEAVDNSKVNTREIEDKAGEKEPSGDPDLSYFFVSQVGKEEVETEKEPNKEPPDAGVKSPGE